VSRFGIRDRLREQSLAAAGLALALTALALGLLPGGGGARVEVLAVTHAIAAGGFVRARDVASVPIAASDRAPSMLASLGSLSGRRSLIKLAGGDFLVRGALAPAGRSAQLGPAERAVALALSSASAPDLRLLRAGRYVDVVVIDPTGSHVAARGLMLLAPASEQSGGIVVTVRAPAAVALSLAAGRDGRELRLLLRADPS
jgi:hypothetical protein